MILVGLLAGLVMSSVPWLATLDPSRPEGMLVRVLQALEAARDLEAHVVLTGEEGAAVEFQLWWLKGGNGGAVKVSFLAPEELKGQVYTFREGLLAHWRPQGDEGVIVRLSLPQEGGSFSLTDFDLREIVTGIRLGTVRISSQRVRLGDGWEAFRAARGGYTLFATFTGQGNAPRLSLFIPPTEAVLTLPGIGKPQPLPPALQGPIRLEVTGRFSSLPAFRRAVFWLDEGEELPHRVELQLARGGQGELALNLRLVDFKTDTGLTLREVLALPPASRTIWE
ncbi:MAG: hypothetical protein XD60_1705 [Acetothermia bacterium 64_32]|nr:MAG: hypothetical protein XD60_1705 [Acetothermia bacterium 64_32]